MLRDLHFARTDKPTPAIPDRVGPEVFFDAKTITKCIRTMGKARAPGISGWTYELVEAACFNETSKAGICKLINLIANGQLNKEAARMLLSTRAVPIGKRSGGVRPLGIGEVFYRISAKLICNLIAKDVRAATNDLQYAVGMPGGAQTCLQVMQAVIDDRSVKRGLLMLDANAAFQRIHAQSVLEQAFKHDTIDRAWRLLFMTYSDKTPVFVTTRDGVVGQFWRQTGVAQGCPLGMIAFCLGFQPVVEATHKAAAAKDGRAFAYADNLNAAIMPPELKAVVEAAVEEGKKHGVVFDLNRASFLWPHDSPLDEEVLRYAREQGIRIVYKAAELLGGAVGSESEQAEMSRICLTKADKLEPLFEKIMVEKELTCQELFAMIHSANVVHVLRSCTPAVTLECARKFDQMREKALATIADATITARMQEELRLRFRHGGWGLASAEEIAPFCYAGARALAANVLTKCDIPDSKSAQVAIESTLTAVRKIREEKSIVRLALPESASEFVPKFSGSVVKHVQSTLVRAMDESKAKRSLKLAKERKDDKEAARLTANRAPKASLALRSRRGLTTDEWRIYFRLKLGLPPVDDMPDFCAACHFDLQQDNWHALSCKRLRGLHIKRHNNISNFIGDTTECIGGHAEIEPVGLGDLKEDGKRDRTKPDGFLIVGGRKLIFDTSVVSPIALSHVRLAASEKLALAADKEKEKRALWDEKSARQGAVFYPVVLETLGGMGKEATKFFQELLSSAPGHRFVTSEIAKGLRERVSVCVARWTAACVRSCLFGSRMVV